MPEMPPLLHLAGRSFLVTGASSGIGRETACFLSELGARVILIGRDRDRLDQTLRSLFGTGHSLEALDLSQTEKIPGWIKNLCIKEGPLSGLVHCAGIQNSMPLRVLNSADFESVYKINVIAAAMLIKGFRQKGCCTSSSSVVLVSSVMGIVGEAAISAYSSSKAAVLGLTRSLALELAREGIRVNCVVPGYVKTEMSEQAFLVLSPDQVSSIESKHPLGFGKPRDVAHAIAFLLADTASWITGSSLVVDGGYTAC